MDELFATVEYVGDVQDWRTVPETEASDDEPEAEPVSLSERDQRAAALKAWDTRGRREVYHGTKSERLASIKKDGLQIKYSGANYSISGQAVYVTTDWTDAMEWSSMALGEREESAILRIEIPDDVVLAEDENAAGVAGHHRIPRDIPPEWITGVVEWSPDDTSQVFDRGRFKKEPTWTSLSTRRSRTFYIVIPMSARQDLSERDQRAAAIKAWDTRGRKTDGPDRSREGSAKRIGEAIGSQVFVDIEDTPKATRAASVVADVLEEMKADGYTMPARVIIGRVASDSQGEWGAIRGVTVRVRGEPDEKQMWLEVQVPETLPDDVEFDDAVGVAFGGQVDTTAIGRYTKVGNVELTPNEEKAWADAKDPLYSKYDKFSVRTMRDVVVHEMGHVQAGHRGDLDSRKLLLDDTFTHPLSIRRAMMRVSQYAASSQDEFLAEAFTRLHRGETLPEDSMKLYKALNGPEVKR